MTSVINNVSPEICQQQLNKAKETFLLRKQIESQFSDKTSEFTSANYNLQNAKRTLNNLSDITKWNSHLLKCDKTCSGGNTSDCGDINSTDIMYSATQYAPGLMSKQYGCPDSCAIVCAQAPKPPIVAQQAIVNGFENTSKLLKDQIDKLQLELSENIIKLDCCKNITTSDYNNIQSIINECQTKINSQLIANSRQKNTKSPMDRINNPATYAPDTAATYAPSTAAPGKSTMNEELNITRFYIALIEGYNAAKSSGQIETNPIFKIMNSDPIQLLGIDMYNYAKQNGKLKIDEKGNEIPSWQLSKYINGTFTSFEAALIEGYNTAKLNGQIETTSIFKSMDSDINFIPMINYYNRAKGNGTLIIKENYTISSDGTVMYTDNQTVRLPTEPSTQIASAQSTIEQSFVQPEVAQAAVAQVEAAQPTKQPTKQPIDDKHLLIYLALIMGILLSIIPGIIFKDNEIFFISSISIAVVCGLILMYYFTIDFIIN
jgi:hypothetical protein